jgi:hypothetical protein
MSGQLLRISDFERDSQMKARVAKRRDPAQIYEFPAQIPPQKRGHGARAWQRGLEIALRFGLGGVLLLAIGWLVWHFIR